MKPHYYIDLKDFAFSIEAPDYIHYRQSFCFYNVVDTF
ncbi:hypothetical protein CSC37_0457 [Escherichia coli]|nr:hypothetical protein CSC37_0457 [Escherichia coli]